MARTPRMIGAFHGAMPSTTPTGSRGDIAIQPGLSEGMTSPQIRVVSAAASRVMLAASIRLKAAQPAVAPTSSIIACTNCSRRPSSAAAALLSVARRAFGPKSAHARNPEAARVATAYASAVVMAMALLTARPVIGLILSKRMVLPVVQRGLGEGPSSTQRHSKLSAFRGSSPT